jgi:leucine dehydrogenase
MRRRPNSPARPHDLLQVIEQAQFEQVVIHQDVQTGLRAIVAVHNTCRGPALGGVRMWPYASLSEALQDALRLAQAMTYKAAVSGLPLGGGKAVIIGDPRKDKSPALLKAFGRLVHSLGGRYLTAEDVGMTVGDMETIRRVTPHVTGTATRSGGSGDPSIMTAIGVFHGIRATLEELGLKGGAGASLDGVRVAVQGVGKVGYRLARLLHEQGVQLVVTDLDRTRAKRAARDFSAEVVSNERIYGVPCDLFAPCALGGVLNAGTIPRLRCRAIAGAANNQLATPGDAQRLRRRSILYAPDFVVNAGGLINIAVGLGPGGYDAQKAERKARGIAGTLRAVYRVARERRCTTAEAAERLAVARLRTGLR